MNEKFKNQYDFTDSVIESIEWTDNMHNINIYILTINIQKII